MDGIENGRARTLRGSTRGAILAAAERLFAARGYEAATIQEIARGAGVSRGAPAYFFGSKRALYCAVVDGALERAKTVIKDGLAEATAEDAGKRLLIAIDRMVDFVAADESFARLVQWVALDDVGDVSPATSSSVADCASELALSAEFLLAVAALCSPPLGHAGNLRRVLGIDGASSSFREARKRHLRELVLGARLDLVPPAAHADIGASDPDAAVA